ncbi:MAG: prolyl oligopeptidase family serine peptidase [Gemmataceae bacterium]|nr:prolyl oligopeptidase family serine peptidase [Gemmataceae bacterium]
MLLFLLAAMPLDTSYLKDHAQTRGFMLGRPVRPRVTPDGKHVLFLRSEPRKAKMALFEFDLATGKTRQLLTPEALLKGAEEKLSAEEKARRERQRVTVGGFTTYHLSRDGSRILLSLSGKLYLVERAALAVLELKTGKGTLLDPKFSPDGTLVSYVLDHDVFVIDPATQKETPVTRGGTEAKPNGVAEFVAQEEMSRFTGYWWSPDGKSIAYQQSDHAGVEKWFVADPAHPEREGHPSYYPRPGKKNVAVRLAITTLGDKGDPRRVEWDAKRHEYLARVDWQKGGLTLLVQDRLQQEQVLLKADPATGKTTRLLVEKDAAWLNLNHDAPHWLEAGDFLWHGEGKDGPELQQRIADGKIVRVLAGPRNGFRAILSLDAKSGVVRYAASADPSQLHVVARALDGKPEALTTEPGLHSAEFGKSGHYVLTSSTLEAMPRSTVHDAKGARVGELPSVAETPPFKVNQRIAKVGDFWTTVVRPAKFDRKKKYPVIVHVYGGPGHLEVLAQMNRRLIDQWIADRGFIVVGIDGRGTPGRGRDWERAVYKKFGSVPLEDQIAGLKALGAKLPELDLERVGVYGWSFGGYMAACAALKRGDVFKCAIAGAPVTEWLDYDTHYTERYLGLPSKGADGYKEGTLLSHAKTLKVPLLLVHGTADDNVYFRHSLRLGDALFREGKEFEMLPLSGLTHLVPDPVVLKGQYGRFAGFFKKHLGEAR